MVKNRRTVYGAVAGVVLALVAYVLTRDDRGGPVSLSLPGATRAPKAADGEMPRIGLDRLLKPHGGIELGKRDIFDFGPPRGFDGTQQGLSLVSGCRELNQSSVHSQVLPIMSTRPKPWGG